MMDTKFKIQNIHPLRAGRKPGYIPGLSTSVALLLFSLFLIVAQGCKKEIELHSHWRQQEITVDGNDSEWQDHLIWFKDHPVAVGIINDSTDLYLLFITTDRNTKQTLMRRGMTIWFSADGKKNKTFGIRYPIGLATYQRWRPYNPDELGMSEQERMEIFMADMLKEMEIIGPGDHSRNHTYTENPYGISLALSDTAATLIYELKIPLQSSGEHPYQIGAMPGNTIRVVLETGSIEGPMIVRSGSGSGQGGMAGGQGGGGGGVRRVGPPGGGRQMGPAEPLNVWLEIHLAMEN